MLFGGLLGLFHHDLLIIFFLIYHHALHNQLFLIAIIFIDFTHYITTLLNRLVS
jgi:hypothetical protein